MQKTGLALQNALQNISLKQACNILRHLIHILPNFIKALLVIVGINIQCSLDIGMSKPIRKLFHIPSAVDCHRCAGMTEVMQ